MREWEKRTRPLHRHTQLISRELIVKTCASCGVSLFFCWIISFLRVLFDFVCSVAWTTELACRFFLRFCSSSSSLRFARCHHGRRGRSTARSSRYRTPMEIAFRSASAQLFQRKSKNLRYFYCILLKKKSLNNNNNKSRKTKPKNKYYKMCDVFKPPVLYYMALLLFYQPTAKYNIRKKEPLLYCPMFVDDSLALLYIQCTVRASPRDWSSAAIIEYVYQPDIPRCVGQWAQDSFSSFSFFKKKIIDFIFSCCFLSSQRFIIEKSNSNINASGCRFLSPSSFLSWL